MVTDELLALVDSLRARGASRVEIRGMVDDLSGNFGGVVVEFPPGSPLIVPEKAMGGLCYPTPVKSEEAKQKTQDEMDAEREALITASGGR